MRDAVEDLNALANSRLCYYICEKITYCSTFPTKKNTGKEKGAKKEPKGKGKSKSPITDG